MEISLIWIAFLRRKVDTWACLHGGGGPQVGEVTRLGRVTRLSLQSLNGHPYLSCKLDQIKM